MKACASCHSFEKGGPNKVGPDLYGVVNRPKGSHEGFKYSAAMQERAAKGEKWTFENLDAFIANPKGYLPGTAMGYAGLKEADKRADVLAYLRSLVGQPRPSCRSKPLTSGRERLPELAPKAEASDARPVSWSQGCALPAPQRAEKATS